MKTSKLPMPLICTGLLLTGAIVSTEAAATVPEDPNTFLTFLEKHEPEDAVSAAAYYDAVDPGGSKATYADWLFQTGFIDDPLTYNTTGPLVIEPGAGVTTVTHRNETDLGFVRVVRTRCEPNCGDPNPEIYSVIENYLDYEAAAAREGRLASVTMEWTSPADGSNPSDRFVVFYAYTGGDLRDVDNGMGGTIPFAPNLDDRGGKEIPGVCNTCHGGTPRILNNDGSYPDNGDTGSLFLAMDLDNFGFDPNRPSLSRSTQQAAYKETNQAVLVTHRGEEEFDEVAEVSRVPAGQEIIEGWYGGPGMPDANFNGEFVPPGWLGAEDLYLDAIVPACRACHAQQERSLDFATYEGFMVFEDAHKELVLQVECGPDDDSDTRDDGGDDQSVMPLAKLTYELFWNTSQADVFKEHFEEVDCDD